MKTVFLESHHLKNPFSGFGQFNYHLIKNLHEINDDDLRLILHAKNINALKKEFGDAFDYKKYFSLTRYAPFRIRKQYDLWHALNQNTKIEPKNNIPYLLTVHDHPKIKENHMNYDDHKVFQEKLNRSTAITYISQYSKDSTHKYYKVPNVPEYVIYNGNPIIQTTLPENFRPKKVSDKPFLFSIGVMQPRKNFILLVKMMPYLKDYNLVIAGNNDTKEGENIKAAIKQLNLQNSVILAGKINDLERQYYYENCTAFVFPSNREGFGLPVIEAMRFGKPVFISEFTCLPEIGGDAAFYWNNLEPKIMADAINNGLKTFADNQDQITKKLIARSNDFSWDKAARQYLEVYKNILQL